MVTKEQLQVFHRELLDVQKILDDCTFVDLIDAKKELQDVLTGLESPLQVMVMGSFSTGKSSFINALLGEVVTAVGALPTTAVIAKLVYGTGKDVTVYFQDETSKSYSREEFVRLTDENEVAWASVREKISYVERSLPLPILKNINIIDSPGLEAKEIHTKITKKFVNHMDVVFWIFSAENAGTGTEVKQLENLNGRLKPIAIINKMDSLDEEEDNPEEFLQEIQRKLDNKVHSVVGISAKMAMSGKISGNNQMLLDSNIGEVQRLIYEDVVPQANEYKVNTMLEDTTNFLSEIYSTVDKIVKQKKSATTQKIYVDIKGKRDNILRNIHSAIVDLKTYAVKESDLGNASACVFIGYMLYCEEKDGAEKGWRCIKYFEIAAKKNILLGQVLLAFCYFINGECDKSEYWTMLAYGCLVKDADSRELEGQLEFLQGVFAISKGNYIDAYYWYEQAIKNGCYIAANNLGVAYFYGEGVKVNYELAMKYYRIAAENDEDIAKFNLGRMYYDGTGTAKNTKEALRWITASAEDGYAVAQYSLYNIYSLGTCGEKNYAKAIKWLKLAAEQDTDYVNDNTLDSIVNARSTLVSVYAGGLSDAYVDYSKAISLGKQTYEKYKDNQAVKQYILENVVVSMGYIYLKGNAEIKKDLLQAIRWLEIAATEGIDIAQHQLGLIYVNNDGIAIDYRKARYWWEKAAAQGYAPAIKDLGYLNALEGKKKTSGVPNDGGCLVWLTLPFGMLGFLYYWLA